MVNRFAQHIQRLTSGFGTIGEAVKRTLDFDRISCPMAGVVGGGYFQTSLFS